MNLTSVMVDISADCPRCKQPFHLNGAAESTLCPACQSPIALPEAFWRMLLPEVIAESVGFAEKEGRNSTIMSGEYGLTLKLQYGKLGARCEKCKTPLPPPAIAEAVAAGPEATLPCACGGRVRVRRPPAWFGAVNAAAVALVGETLAADTAGAPAGPQRIFCYECGASLQVDGSSRTVACSYCSQQILLPDEVWLRLHPAEKSERWFIVLDLGDAVGVMPEDCWTFCDFTLAADGNVVIAYHADDEGEAGHRCRVASVDRRGMLKWIQDGVEFSEETLLLVNPADGQVVLVDREQDFVRYLDAATGRPLKTVRGPASDEGQGFSVYEHRGVAVDHDGTLIVARYGSGDSGETLRRYTRDGAEVPMWPGARGKAGDRPAWPRIPHQPRVLPDDSKFFVGWDGFLYLVHEKGQHIAQIARDGTCRGVLPLPGFPADDVEGFAVDRAGVMVILFEHAERVRDQTWAHLARVSPQGQVELWLGPHAPPGRQVIGQYDDKLEMMPDGTVYVGHDLGSLRVVAPDGRLLWRSPGSKDDEVRAELEQLRRRKKVARDAEDGDGDGADD